MIFLILLGIALVGCRQSAQPTQPPTVNDMMITLTTDPNPPQVGEGVLVITASQPDGTPLDVAKISIRGDMTHAGMTPEFAETTTGENGVYRVPFNWSMSGDWIIQVTIRLTDDQVVGRDFEVTVE